MKLTTDEIAAMRRKVAWRILPLVIVLYLVSYLDRANVGFAKLRMARDLHFSEEVFGLGIGIFFIGYLILEIPGALLVERWSARKWFARILITWGVISAATAVRVLDGGFGVDVDHARTQVFGDLREGIRELLGRRNG